MNTVNWWDVFAMAQIFIGLGAFCGQLTFCWMILMIELAIVWYVVLPIFILVCINLFFGGEVCLIAILLTFAIGMYYLIFQRR